MKKRGAASDPHPASVVAAPHPATLDESHLLRQCQIRVGRVGGPGGQHRNKVATAVFLTHTPTGVTVQATERRSQIENRRVALNRIRMRLAIEIRTRPCADGHQPSALWQSRRVGSKLVINSDHWDYPPLLAEALDVAAAFEFDIASAANALGVTTSQLTKMIHKDRAARAHLSLCRARLGLRPLTD